MTTTASIDGLCKAGPYRLPAFLTILGTNAVCFLLFLLAPHLHPSPKGPLTAQDANEGLLNLVFTLGIPCVLLFISYFTVKGWTVLKNELIYCWQGMVSLFVVIGICLTVVIYLLCVILFFDYHASLDPGGHLPADPFPADRSFSFLVGRLFMYAGGFLVFAFAMGLLSPNVELSEQPAKATP